MARNPHKTKKGRIINFPIKKFKKETIQLSQARLRKKQDKTSRADFLFKRFYELEKRGVIEIISDRGILDFHPKRLLTIKEQEICERAKALKNPFSFNRDSRHLNLFQNLRRLKNKFKIHAKQGGFKIYDPEIEQTIIEGEKPSYVSGFLEDVHSGNYDRDFTNERKLLKQKKRVKESIEDNLKKQLKYFKWFFKKRKIKRTLLDADIVYDKQGKFRIIERFTEVELKGGQVIKRTYEKVNPLPEDELPKNFPILGITEISLDSKGKVFFSQLEFAREGIPKWVKNRSFFNF